MKIISLISPDPTINIIKDGKIIKKIVYHLCENENCITRVINEDVPSSFYNNDGEIRCRYCRRPNMPKNRKINEEELSNYIKSLPKSV